MLGTRRARRAFTPVRAAAPLSAAQWRELLVADMTPLRMTRAAAEYVRRAAPGDALDIKARLRTVGREESCFGCLRGTFVLDAESPGWVCTDCGRQGRGWERPATMTIGELYAVDVALGAS